MHTVMLFGVKLVPCFNGAVILHLVKRCNVIFKKEFALSEYEISLWLKSLFTASQDKGIGEFKEYCFKHLQSVIQFDSGLWTTRSDMFNKVNVHWVDDSFLFNQPDAFMENYFSIASTADTPDLLNVYLINHPNQFIDLWQVVSVDEWQRSVYYSEHCKQYGVENALAALVSKSENTSVSHAISIYRSDFALKFTAQERELITFLLPFLLQAFRLNLLYSFIPNSSVRVVRGVVDRFGTIIEAQDQFISIMTHCDVLDDGVLKLESHGGITTSSGFWVDRYLIQIEHEKGLFFIKITLPLVEELLSPKEIEVSKLLLNGLSNKDIANYLCRSPNTVKNQVNSILQKLNVNTREAAVLALMEWMV
ncbi:MAG: DNA-binding CsgD family transcriptional regulator [Pseudoalteromonas rhizosphaerae]|jgi:DNA-binding CsgD family transcriptional regulator|uniref:Response regulator transcription factor n=1 Tax=Pseudoalteromonas neustonica TaxID=1840331 RepID=A0ABY3FAZ4_9GAMM|nr:MULTISPECIES: LuxR C-terminal-related transcriptional regulator [Pseudoalteromonas]MBB1292378.1 response regulator transcription factor [Pseudoalteromonas sp. SR41-4]TVU81833.1 response regulator transcription factor [Pseudoalteromonas neustonica]